MDSSMVIRVAPSGPVLRSAHALVDESLDDLQRRAGDRFGGVDGATAREDGEPRQRRALLAVEQIPAPVERGAHGAMAGSRIRRRRAEVLKGAVQARKDLGRGQNGGPRRD